MNYNSFMILRYKSAMKFLRCILAFLSIFIPMLLLLVISRSYSESFFLAGSLFSGWFAWTFVEYMLHRFGHHEHHHDKPNASRQLHLYHHTHPTEIKVTMLQRTLLFSVSIACIGLSFYLNNYFSLIGGFVCGVASFFLMHYILHQPWSAKIFPRLHRYHIYHHCKYPNHCHGICVPWWDILFKTVPPENKKITGKITAFYYGK